MKEKKIKAIILEPNKVPEVKVIQNELDILQTIVGGYIEVVREEGFDIIINEEGKLEDLEPNFKIYGGNDYIAGTVIFVGVDYENGEFASLTDEQIKFILSIFANRFDSIKAAAQNIEKNI